MSEDTEPADDVMEATYRALCAQGFAALTMQDIADEWTRSKAALHYHYDTKEDLLHAFLVYLADSFEQRLVSIDEGHDEPIARLQAFLDRVVADRGDDHYDFKTAMLEIRAQAPYNERFRAELRAFDDRMCEHLRAIIGAGIERGDFREGVDVDEVASFVVTAINGAHTQHVTTGQPPACARRHIQHYLNDQLVADERAPVLVVEGDDSWNADTWRDE